MKQLIRAALNTPESFGRLYYLPEKEKPLKAIRTRLTPKEGDRLKKNRPEGTKKDWSGL